MIERLPQKSAMDGWPFQVAFVLLFIGFLSTPLSQIPAVLEWTFSNTLLNGIFFAAFVFLMVCVGEKLFQVRVIWLVSLALIFVSYCLLMNVYSSGGYLDGTYFNAVLMSLFFYMLGTVSSAMITERNLKRLLTACFAGSVITSAFIMSTVYTGLGDWLDNPFYIYVSKNSISLIAATAMISVLVYAKPRSRLFRALELGGCAYLLFFLMIMQSRMVLIGLAAAALFHILFVSKYRARWILLIVLIVSAVLVVGSAREFVIKALRIGDIYVPEGQTYLDAFSSGRLTLIDRALASIAQNPLFGIGKYYVDMMYISIVAEMGLVGAILPLAALVAVFVQNIKLWLRSSKSLRPLNILLVMLTLQFAVESFGEGMQPFGPGTTVLLLWFLSAYAWQLSLQKSGGAEGIAGDEEITKEATLNE